MNVHAWISLDVNHFPDILLHDFINAFFYAFRPNMMVTAVFVYDSPQSFPNPGVVPQCKSWSQISVHTSQGLGLLRETLTATEELMAMQIHTVTQRG